MLGLWHLLTHLFIICFLVIATVHPELLKFVKSSAPIESDGYVLELESTGDRKSLHSSNSIIDRTWSKEDLCVAYTFTLCSIMMSVLLIYGAARNRPGYLLPFFSLQVFDFCLSSLTVIGSFSLTSNIKLWLKDQGLENCPGFQRILEMDSDLLMLLIVTFFVLLLFLRAYFLSVVWACYKYAQMVSAYRNSTRAYRVDPDTEMLLPPSYEDAIKIPLSEQVAEPPQIQQPPPPPYEPVTNPPSNSS